MPSKSEYDKTFNELLGTDIKWDKLSKEELAQLMVIFAHPEILADKLGLEVKTSKSGAIYRSKFIEELVSNFKEAAENYDGPLINKIREAIRKDTQ